MIVVQLAVAIVAIGAAFGVVAALVATAVALVPVVALGLRARRTTSAA